MKVLDCSIFCERAKELFGERGQVELASAIGISQGVISVIKRGDSKTPSADTVYRIANYFNVSADWLLGLSDIKSSDKATKDLCDTLGLSDTTIHYLTGDYFSHTREELKAEEPRKAKSYEFLRKNDLQNVRTIINKLVEETATIENTDTLLHLLISYYQNLNGDNNIYFAQLAPGKTTFLQSSKDGQTISKIDFDTPNTCGIAGEFKELVLTSAINNINTYLITKKNNVLKKEKELNNGNYSEA